jgi:chemotaxis protein methyltransferase CheR
MPSSLPEGLTGDPYYSALKALLVDFTGLNYYADKDAELTRRLERRLRVTGARDCAAYLQLLRDPVRGAPERDELIAEITIDETYFFRHREHFDALRDIVLPDLMAGKCASRSLRIWCAGCADGPEPYSLAILLKREMSHQIRGWQVSIVGTDLNRSCLARAREGKFEDWALRSLSDDLKRDCFTREGRQWVIAPQYKEWISFQYHNLVEDHFPSLVHNLSAFDLIVCRNVMIYFGPELMQRMIHQFYESLVPGAWLLVGPTEPNMRSFTSFHTVNAPGVTLYQKPGHPAPVPARDVFEMVPAPPLRPVSPWLPAPAFSGPSPAPVEHSPTLEDARRQADRGAWEDAANCCTRLLEKDNLNSEVHFYHALVLEQMQKHADAERSLRRAIYLDRQFVLPHYYLGLLLQSRGDARQAAHSFQNALELLSRRSGNEVLADADGITVAEMTKLARMQLEILRGKG